MKIEILSTKSGWIMSDLTITDYHTEKSRQVFYPSNTECFDSAPNLIASLKKRLGIPVQQRDSKGQFLMQGQEKA
jgi:hypothetical protein